MSESFIEKIKKSVKEKIEQRRTATQRRKLASSITLVRSMERHKNPRTKFLSDRGMNTEITGDYANDGYIDLFLGLSYLFEKTRDLGEKPLVIDIGAGTTRGISEIAASPLGEGLDFKATGLAWHGEIEQNLGRERYTQTPVEILKGFGNNTVSCILGLNSVAYSDQPDLAVKRMDEVLVEGGFIKLTGSEDTFHGMHRPARIEKELKKLGYDTALLRRPHFFDILVAVKPGREDSPTASELLNEDAKRYNANKKSR